MKILLVDDHKGTVRDLSSLIGRRIKCEIRAAYKGDDAVRMAEEFKPDVVVLDIDLPVLNGFDVLEELKKRGIDTRVIMLSGAYTETEHIVRCIRAGACDFIKKPADVSKIVESIERHYLLENADNLQIYAQAPGLIKQLIDRAEEEERRTKNAEVDKMITRAQSAEKELHELKLSNIQADVARQNVEKQLHEFRMANSQADVARQLEAAKAVRSSKQDLLGRWRSWWNKISPNERAAYIGLIGVCLTGALAMTIAVYNKSTSENKGGSASSIFLDVKPTTTPSNAPLTSPQIIPSPPAIHKDLGLTLEQYHDKLSSFGGRLGLRGDYLNSVEGFNVVWQGIVENAGVGSGDYGYINIRSETAPYEYGVISAVFNHLNQGISNRIHTLEVGDLVQISGSLITKREAEIEADNIVVIRPVTRSVKPAQP